VTEYVGQAQRLPHATHWLFGPLDRPARTLPNPILPNSHTEPLTLYSEDDLIPLSALQHLLFCERQCALIHVEQLWNENRLTAEGRIMHEKVHELGSETRGNLRTARGLRLCSFRLGLSGQADVVEFHRIQTTDHRLQTSDHRLQTTGPGTAAKENVPNPFADIFKTVDTDSERENSTSSIQHPASNISTSPSDISHQPSTILPTLSGLWRPFPVEYKRGRPKKNSCDEVQLCAQAMCLEEMLNVTIESGALFYGKKRRRHQVRFSETLRAQTQQAAQRVHELIGSRTTPPANYEKKCDRCSLYELCQPKQVANGSHSANRYLNSLLRTED